MRPEKIAELVDFYRNNELDEIFSEEEQDLTQIINSKIKLIIPKKDPQQKVINQLIDQQQNNQTSKIDFASNSKNSNLTKNQFITPVFSTKEAVSSLAKRFNSFQNNNSSAISIDKIVEEAKSLAKAAQNIDQLKKAVEEFNGCNLKKMATNTVFADGNPNSKIMVIGEAPGNHEDLQGIPFCGDSGKMLDEMFSHIGMTRKENLYITNVIFWRPPGNRRPTEEELAICKPFVDRHIELISPKVIVLVGATAMNAITKISESISKTRGQFKELGDNNQIKTFTIFHPSYLMRQSAKKKIAWQDMLTLEKYLSNE